MFNTSKIVLEAFENNESVDFLVSASPRALKPKGIGKTVYSLKCLIDIYGDWETAKQYLVFTPEQFLNFLKLGERIPLLVWDDAGYWLNRRYWFLPLVRSVTKIIQITRPHITSIMFTTPFEYELPSPILDNIAIRIHIVKKESYGRMAKAYKYVEDLVINKKYHKLLYEDYFNIHFKYYAEYEKERLKYITYGIRDLEAVINSRQL